jgi:hypothetical protein
MQILFAYFLFRFIKSDLLAGKTLRLLRSMLRNKKITTLLLAGAGRDTRVHWIYFGLLERTNGHGQGCPLQRKKHKTTNHLAT